VGKTIGLRRTAASVRLPAAERKR